MSKFEDILENTLRGTSLKQIMVKVDPKHKSDIANSSGYTGYVLEENPEGVTMYIIKPPEGMSNTMTIPNLTCGDDNRLSGLIDICKNHLINKDSLDSDDPQLRTFDDIQDPGQLISVLSQYGLDDGEMLNIFADFFTADTDEEV